MTRHCGFRAAAGRPLSVDKPPVMLRRLWNTRIIGVIFIALLLTLREIAAAGEFFPAMSFPRITVVAISGTLSLKRPPGAAHPAPPARPTPEHPVGHPTPARTDLARSSTLNGRAIKVTIVLETAEIAMLKVQDGQRRTTLRIKVAGRNVSVDIAAKSLCKAIATIAEAGADQCVAIVQGKLERGDMVSEAGLVVQLKTPKATSTAAQRF